MAARATVCPAASLRRPAHRQPRWRIRRWHTGERAVPQQRDVRASAGRRPAPRRPASAACGRIERARERSFARRDSYTVTGAPACRGAPSRSEVSGVTATTSRNSKRDAASSFSQRLPTDDSRQPRSAMYLASGASARSASSPVSQINIARIRVAVVKGSCASAACTSRNGRPEPCATLVTSASTVRTMPSTPSCECVAQPNNRPRALSMSFCWRRMFFIGAGSNGSIHYRWSSQACVSST